MKLAIVFHGGADAPLPHAAEAAMCWVPLEELLRGCGLAGAAGWEHGNDVGVASAALDGSPHHGCQEQTQRRRSREELTGRDGATGGDDVSAAVTDHAEECRHSSSSSGGSLGQAPSSGLAPRDDQVAGPLTSRPEFARISILMPHVLAAILAR